MTYINWILENWDEVARLLVLMGGLIGGPMAIWLHRSARLGNELVELLDEAKESNKSIINRAEIRGKLMALRKLRKMGRG